MPIVNIEGLGKIEFPDSMSPEQIDRAIKNEILPMVAQRVPSAMVASLPSAVAGTANPFTKGTAKADPNYKAGDRYRYRVVDLFTKLESREGRGGIVKQVTDTEVIYGNGRVTDLLGNMSKDPQGRTLSATRYSSPNTALAGGGRLFFAAPIATMKKTNGRST